MSLMIGCHAEALNDNIKMDDNELFDARWFSKDEMRGHADAQAS